MDVFSEVLARIARLVLGIREVPLFPGVHKVIMRAARIIEYQIDLPMRTAADIADLVKKFLAKKDISYSEDFDAIRLGDTLSGEPCFFIPENGAVSFYVPFRASDDGVSRWDGFIREMKSAF